MAARWQGSRLPTVELQEDGICVVLGGLLQAGEGQPRAQNTPSACISSRQTALCPQVWRRPAWHPCSAAQLLADAAAAPRSLAGSACRACTRSLWPSPPPASLGWQPALQGGQGAESGPWPASQRGWQPLGGAPPDSPEQCVLRQPTIEHAGAEHAGLLRPDEGRQAGRGAHPG